MKVRRAGVELALSQPPPYHQSAPAWELHPGTGRWESHPTVQREDPLDHECLVELENDHLSGAIDLKHEERALTFKFWVTFEPPDTFGPRNIDQPFGDWTARYMGEPCEFWIGEDRFHPSQVSQLSIMEADDGRVEVVLPWAANRSEHTAGSDGRYTIDPGHYEAEITRV